MAEVDANTLNKMIKRGREIMEEWFEISCKYLNNNQPLNLSSSDARIKKFVNGCNGIRKSVIDCDYNKLIEKVSY